jgi:cob(I)alamin adenosyltransferase
MNRSSLLSLRRFIVPASRRSTRFEKINRNNNTMTDEHDIEDIHKTAILQGSTTYTDPSTGFLVFSELAHLQRGTCCGNQCRHCPYGWSNVVIRNNNSKKRPPAKAESGNRVQIQALKNQMKIAQQEYQASKNNSTNLQQASPKIKTGGRNGGRLTDKNVPYTRQGDKGTSQLLTGERRAKDDAAFEAMGTVDELCSVVGVVFAELERDQVLRASAAEGVVTYDRISKQLMEIMSRLFDIGSHVAKPRNVEQIQGDDSSESESNDTNQGFIADGIGGGFDQVHIEELEDWIDLLTEELPDLTSFILPTGTVAAAQLHVARCVCRRAERRVIPLVDKGVCDPNALKYLNRLSDFLFSAARWANWKRGSEEVQYRRPVRGAKQRVAVSLSNFKTDKK